MIVKFLVKNFRSYWQRQELSFISSSDRTHETTHCFDSGSGSPSRVLRTALIFGPNAGGKTNLLSALSLLRELVLHSTVFNEQKLAELYTPFSFAPSPRGAIVLEIEIVIEATRYCYSVSFDAHRILAERLLAYRTGKSQRWFDRKFNPINQSEDWATFSPSFRGPREIWRKATRPTSLFLTTAAQLNSELLRPVMYWFEHCLEIVFRSDVGDLNRLAADIANPQLKSRMLSVLQGAGLAVKDVRLVEMENCAGRKDLRRSMKFLHPHPTAPAAWLTSATESAGTHKLFGILGPLLRALQEGKLLVIDEFDTSLHVTLAKLLLQLAYAAAVDGKRTQLLLTSQNAALLDLEILRRDEIWLVECDGNKASVLRSLVSTGVRKREKIMKGYLSGRYGAVPRIRADAITWSDS